MVGALPKYLQAIGRSSGVIIPKYATPWIRETEWQVIHRGVIHLHHQHIGFTIEQARHDDLAFPLFVANIPGKYDRPGIYIDPAGHGYGDETERALCFQMAVLEWIASASGHPGVLHCHDHHTGLIPFMLKFCPAYQSLAHVPTVFTIHNGQYHGAFSYQKMYLLPPFVWAARGLLDWNDYINPLATAIKTAGRVTTVSPAYLREMTHQSNGIESLVQHEWHKCVGILNGIDASVWDPASDKYIAHRLTDGDWSAFKRLNKRVLHQHFRLEEGLPQITFKGRQVGEKGPHMLTDLITRVLNSGLRVNFAVLGTGEPWLHEQLAGLPYRYPGRVDVALQYNEGRAHQVYAGADFLFMPSRVEPCGLNQMYAMRYGTVPVVRRVGGLSDTVPDVGEPDGSGRGIQFNNFNIDDAHLALYRAAELYIKHPEQMLALRHRITTIDFSWQRAAREYGQVYDELMGQG